MIAVVCCLGVPIAHAQTKKQKAKEAAPSAQAPAEEEAESTPSPKKEKQTGSIYPLDVSSLREYPRLAPEVQRLLRVACGLTQQGLRYQYGSADPKNGGMDCSGFVNYVLRQVGIDDPPRQANLMYSWVRKAGLFRAVLSVDGRTFELNELRPGDLVFWTGTYSISRDPPVTHVMIYVGTDTEGHRWMVGASEGRYAMGRPRAGVSAFEFKLPGFPPPPRYTSGTSRFVGYGHIPGLPHIAPEKTEKSAPKSVPAADPDRAAAPSPATQKSPLEPGLKPEAAAGPQASSVLSGKELPAEAPSEPSPGMNDTAVSSTPLSDAPDLPASADGSSDEGNASTGE